MDIRENNYNIEEYAAKCVASALCKVFVNDQENIEESTHDTKNSDKGAKYKVKILNKKGEEYVRYATREQISALRSRTDIKTVELTDDGVPISKAKPKPGYDKIGKEDNDVDNDGDSDESDKYLKKRREAIGKSKAMKEATELLSKNVDSEEGENNKKLDITRKKNKVKINPTLGKNDNDNEMNVEESTIITSSCSSRAQEILRSALLEKKEEPKVGPPEESKEDKKDVDDNDPRGTYARINVIKNKIRSALGIKNPIIMSAEETDEENISEGIPAALAVGAGVAGAAMAGAAALRNKMQKDRKEVTGAAKPAPSSVKPGSIKSNIMNRNAQLKSLMQSTELEGEQIDELNRYEKEKGKNTKDGRPTSKGGTAKNNKAFQYVTKQMGDSRMRTGEPGRSDDPHYRPRRGEKWKKGTKPPTAKDLGKSPEQKIQKRKYRTPSYDNSGRDVYGYGGRSGNWTGD